MPKLSNTQRMAEADLKAAKTAREQKKLASADPSAFAMLPNGTMVNIREYIEARPAFKARGNIEDFSKIIKDYTPEKTYAWPIKDDKATQAKINMGLYIPLTKEQVNAVGELITHEGVDNKVYWYGHILVEIVKPEADRMYEAPKVRALQQLMHEGQLPLEEEAKRYGAKVEFEKSYGRE